MRQILESIADSTTCTHPCFASPWSSLLDTVVTAVLVSRMRHLGFASSLSLYIPTLKPLARPRFTILDTCQKRSERPAGRQMLPGGTRVVHNDSRTKK